MSHPWAKVHKILGGEGLRWQSIFVPVHPKYKIKRIKSKGLRYGLEHREKEAQLLSLSIHGAADYGQGRRQTWKSSIILFGGLQPHLAYLRRLLSLYWGQTHGWTHTHSPHQPPIFHMSLCPLDALSLTCFPQFLQNAPSYHFICNSSIFFYCT